MATTINCRDRRIALTILTVVNFLNYIDRYVVAAVFEPIRRELHFSDAELGWLLSAFMIAYAITSPAFGRLGDLFARKYLIAIGVTLWSFGCVKSARISAGHEPIAALTVLLSALSLPAPSTADTS